MFTNLTELPIKERQLELERRVQKGAAFLDEVDPTWHQRVDLTLLRMQSACRCVLGQIVAPDGYYNGFSRAVSGSLRMCTHSMSMQDAIARGFHLELTAHGPTRVIAWTALADLWKTEILWRRG